MGSQSVGSRVKGAAVVYPINSNTVVDSQSVGSGQWAVGSGQWAVGSGQSSSQSMRHACIAKTSHYRNGLVLG